jgi:hypothetical protein
MKQLKISLTDDLRRHLEAVSAAAGHSLAEEIRRRLERTLVQDGSDPETAELLAAIATFANHVKRETGHAWHRHAGSHEALRRAIGGRLRRLKPEGSAVFRSGGLPDRRTVTVNTHDPVTMGHLIEMFDVHVPRERENADRRKVGSQINESVVPSMTEK